MVQAYFITKRWSRESFWQISFSGRISLYSLSMRWMRAAIASRLFFPNRWDRKSMLLLSRMMRAASSRWGKLGRLSWQERVRRVVSHSLMVSESFSFQLENHFGVQWAKSWRIRAWPRTSPHFLQMISPLSPSGNRRVLWHSGHFKWGPQRYFDIAL